MKNTPNMQIVINYAWKGERRWIKIKEGKEVSGYLSLLYVL